MSNRPTTWASRSRLDPRPNAASRSTRWTHRRTLLLPGLRGRDGITVVGLGAGLALDEPHGAAVGDVDGGQEFEVLIHGARLRAGLRCGVTVGAVGAVTVGVGGRHRVGDGRGRRVAAPVGRCRVLVCCAFSRKK